MNHLDPAERILFPVIISVRADTADLLTEMADDMGLSMDEVLSAIAEESVSELESCKTICGDVYIPDRCSKADLLNLLGESQ